MAGGQSRTYRQKVSPAGLTTFQVSVKETDLLIAVGLRAGAAAGVKTDLAGLKEAALASIHNQRRFIEERIASQPEFLLSLEPLAQDPLAPAVVQEMLAAGLTAGTGPMAAVAGALAGQVGRALLALSPEVIVENGGDLFLAAKRELRVALHAGRSPLSDKLGLSLPASAQPLGISTSSGRLGHSLSLGRAEAATVLADSPALADALATALGNRVKTKADLKPALDWLAGRPGARGGLVILGADLAAWGELKMIRL